MVDIFSKKDGPRREDVVAKRMINDNKATIHRLADQISSGGFSRSRAAMAQAKEEPKPAGLNIHLLGGGAKPSEPDRVLRISLNDRVVVMDANSGKQMELLGQLKTRGGQKYFALATAENGFLSPLGEEIQDRLGDLNGVVIESQDVQEKFVRVIKDRLEI